MSNPSFGLKRCEEVLPNFPSASIPSASRALLFLSRLFNVRTSLGRVESRAYTYVRILLHQTLHLCRHSKALRSGRAISQVYSWHQLRDFRLRFFRYQPYSVNHLIAAFLSVSILNPSHSRYFTSRFFLLKRRLPSLIFFRYRSATARAAIGCRVALYPEYFSAAATRHSSSNELFLGGR